MLLCGTWMALALTASANTISGRIFGIADGDTVTVLDAQHVQHKIRLAGIDAPEKSQPFGNQSKQSLSDLAFDKTVVVEADKRDRYGREVGKVLVNGRDVNLIQVERGMAWHYKAYAGEQSINDRALYEAAEAAARTARRGLWRDPGRRSVVADRRNHLPANVDEAVRLLQSLVPCQSRRAREWLVAPEPVMGATERRPKWGT